MIAEALIAGVWRLLPHGLREKLSEKIRLIQERALIPVPRSRAVVYAFGEETRKQFPDSIAGESLHDAAADLSLPGKSSQKPAVVTNALNVSLLTTCLNEGKSIEHWLESVCSQTILPEEVVICDGGSVDDTLEIVQRWRGQRGASLPFRLHILTRRGCNIAQGRNAAAAHAGNEIFLFSDVGCVLDEHWAERMLIPFAVQPELSFVMGWYRPAITGRLAEALFRYAVPQLAAVDPRTFLPSGRSMAVKRSAFLRAGRFPEYLTFAGEDSLFDYYLKSTSERVAFVPDAFVAWQAPQGALLLWKMIFRYSCGDAEGGKLFWAYYQNLLRQYWFVSVEALCVVFLFLATLLCNSMLLAGLGLLVSVAVVVRISRLVFAYRPFAGAACDPWQKCWRVPALLLLTTAQPAGFVRGLLLRKEVERRKLHGATSGHVVLFVPARLCLADDQVDLRNKVIHYLAEPCHVTVLYGDETEMDEGVMFDHPLLESYSLAGFSLSLWQAKHREFFLQSNRRFLVEDCVENEKTLAMLHELKRLGAARVVS